MVKEETKEEVPENQKKFEEFPEYTIYEYIPPTSEEVRALIRKRSDFIEEKMKEYGYDDQEDLFVDERWHDATYNELSDITYLAGKGELDHSFLDLIIECENDENIKIIEIMIAEITIQDDEHKFYRAIKSKAESEDFFNKLHLIIEQVAKDNNFINFNTDMRFYVSDKSGKIPNTNIYRLYIKYQIL